MDYAAFVIRYPEFLKTSQPRVEAALVDAASECSAEAYGSLYDRAVGLLAARLIALSPYGQSSRTDDGGTTYDDEFFRLQEIAGLGPRVL